MSDMNNQPVEQPVNFDAIKIGLASPELIRTASAFSDRARTGSAIAVNTKRSDIKG